MNRMNLLCDINDMFALFVDDEIINLLRYAQQKLNKFKIILCSRMHRWTSTNSEKIKKFLGLMLWIGFVKVNSVANYWSKGIIFN